jgi:PAS domain S-box-containing protein
MPPQLIGRWPIMVFASFLIASLISIAYLGRTVMSDLNALSTAQNDDVSWNMSQLEVEVLRLRNAAYDASQSSDSNLSEFRQRFDIFYSRVSILTQSALYRSSQGGDPTVRAGMTSATTFLDIMTPIVDGPDASLRKALPDIRSRVGELRPELRAVALAGLQIFAREDAARRENLSGILIKLAASIFALILVLIASVAVLIMLYQRGKRFAHDNQVVRSRFEAVVASSLDAVVVVDTSGKIIEFNSAAEAVFGYSREDALGGDMAEMIVPKHMRGLRREGMRRLLDTCEDKITGTGRTRLEGMRKSGEIFPVELSISLAEAGGERVFVSFMRDITKELQSEQELRSARDKAQESEKAKSDLLTVMSHEMRTPLNGIMGSLSLIEQGNFSERQKRHFSSISVSGELLLSHVNHVLDLSSLMADAPQHEQTYFDLPDMVQKVADGLRANAEALGNKIKVEFLSSELGVVCGYETPLQQCLINLVGNAIKFTSDGTVSIEVERLSSDDLVEMRVSDNGVGIAPENLERIFEEFVMIDTSFNRKNAGTGLGLAITKRLIEAMDGEIEADSILDEGSLFTIRIPLAMAGLMSHAPPEPNNTTPMVISAGLKALVVDDNEINRMIMTDMLLDFGFEVDQASDGFEAISIMSENAFDIALMDISMPGIDGIETLNRIRALDVAWNNIPTIAVTAHASAQDHDRILQAPFGALLVKPIDPSLLNAKITAVLGDKTPVQNAANKENNVTDFQARFGEEKYRGALKDLRSELLSFFSQLEMEAALTPAIKEEAHRLSGSAAVLGKQSLWTQLQNLENCDAGTWPSTKGKILSEFQKEIASLM